MNLYKVMLTHYAPKDSQEGIFAYVVAKSDKNVYEWIKSNPKVNGRSYYSVYDGLEENDDYDEPENVINEIIENQGILNTDYADDYLTDLYYGRTLDYWKLVKEDVNMSLVERMINVGIDIVIIKQ